jgi:outer membrane protein OmpA-like peptidoglycan-associated protein
MPANRFLAFALCLFLAGCASSEKSKQPLAVAMPDPKVTQAWLDDNEPRVREAIKDSHFEMKRGENVLVVTAPVQGTFNPDRPSMLLPVTLGPISRIAKLLENDQGGAVLVIGHADSSGAAEANRELSHERARAFTAIFRLSGLKQNRLMVKGMGSDMPRAANDSVEGRALNRRVEIILTSKNTMRALVAKYSQPVPAAALVAVDSADSAAGK